VLTLTLSDITYRSRDHWYVGFFGTPWYSSLYCKSTISMLTKVLWKSVNIWWQKLIGWLFLDHRVWNVQHGTGNDVRKCKCGARGVINDNCRCRGVLMLTASDRGCIARQGVVLCWHRYQSTCMCRITAEPILQCHLPRCNMLSPHCIPRCRTGGPALTST